MFIAFDKACSVYSMTSSVKRLVKKLIHAFMFAMHCKTYCFSKIKLQSLIKLEDESLSCDMYEALNNVRIM